MPRFTTMLMFILFVAAFAPLCQAAPAPRTVFCLGDSITEGGGGHESYRHYLSEFADATGPIRFVGPFTDAKKFQHAGRGGWSVQKLAPEFPKWFTDHPADILLIHANHNNFADKKPVPEIIAAQESIIRAAHKINPACTIILACPTPATKLPKYSYFDDLRPAQAALVAKLAKDNCPVLLVHPETDFDTAGLMPDGVHMRPAGARHLAKAFATAFPKQ